MPPKVKTSYDDIINAAIVIVREKGIEHVNARSVASKLNCSIQPIFRTFGSMEDFKEAVYSQAGDIFNTTLLRSLENSDEGFLALGLAYINFAKKETNLFRMLFMTNVFNHWSLADIAGTTPGDDVVIDVICEATGLNASKAQELYTGIWFTAHGIASLISTNNCSLNDEEIKKVLKSVYMGILHTLRNEDI